jgi:UDP-N-acetyl-D-glucosamine dehydrogenase
MIRLLQQQGASVCYHDPYVPQVREDGKTLASAPLTPELLRGSDCVVIATDHSGVDYQLVAKESPRVVDTRNALRRAGVR